MQSMPKLSPGNTRSIKTSSPPRCACKPASARVQPALPWGKHVSASPEGWTTRRRAGLSPEQHRVLLARHQEALGGGVGHPGAPKIMSPQGLELQAWLSGTDPIAQIPMTCSRCPASPGTAAWEPGGCSGVVVCAWVCWAVGRNTRWVQDRGGPMSAASMGGSRWGDEAARALASPHLGRWLLVGRWLHDFGRPVAVVPLLLLGQFLLHQVNVAAGGQRG